MGEMSRRLKGHRVMLVGDSMIEYGDWQDLLPDYEVINLGCSGESVEELQTRARRIVTRQPAPDLLLVMIGTNNVAMERFDFLPAYADIVATFKTAYPGVLLVINSLLPMDLYYLSGETVERVNDRLRNLARQTKSVYLDAWSGLVDRNGYCLPGVLADEVHLTPKGYQLWAGRLEIFLENRVGESPANEVS